MVMRINKRDWRITRLSIFLWRKGERGLGRRKKKE